MGLKVVCLILVVASAVVVLAGNEAALQCIKQKYSTDLGEPFNNCYEASGELQIPRIKDCYQRSMLAANVYETRGKKVTVNRNKVGDYARSHSNFVGRAMMHCYNNNTKADDQVYQKPSKMNQCVFLGMKPGCVKN